jgi:hypothetical protein
LRCLSRDTAGPRVPDDVLLRRVTAFNVGIDIGQPTAIVAVLAVAAVASMTFGRNREPALLKASSARTSDPT